MDKEVSVYDCVVTEEQWLDVKFTNRKYLQDEKKQLSAKTEQGILNRLFSKKAKPEPMQLSDSELDYVREPSVDESQQLNAVTSIPHKKSSTTPFTGVRRAVALGILIVALLVGMRFVDSGFAGEIFVNARTAYTSSITSTVKMKETIKLPVVYTVASISDGDVMIQGGRIVFSITSGTVTSVFDNCLEIKVNDRLSIVYSELTDVYVEEGQEITTNTAIGKYEDSTFISFIYDGVKVVNISTDNKSITFQI